MSNLLVIFVLLIVIQLFWFRIKLEQLNEPDFEKLNDQVVRTLLEIEFSERYIRRGHESGACNVRGKEWTAMVESVMLKVGRSIRQDEREILVEFFEQHSFEGVVQFVNSDFNLAKLQPRKVTKRYHIVRTLAS